MLTAQDISKIEMLESMKEQVKALEEEMKPKIEAAYHEAGDAPVAVGARVIKLTAVERETVAWKDLAYAYLTEERIAEVKARYAKQSVSYRVKLMGRIENVYAKAA